MPRMAEGHTEGDRRAEQVTVSQAAKLLQVHRNTVHNYIKNGRIKASKVMEGGREYYLIERDSLPSVQKGRQEHTLDAQTPAIGTGQPTEIAAMLVHRLEDLVQRYGQELGSVREELGAERVRREQAERERDELLEALRGVPERSETYREGEERGEVPTSDTEQPRRSWLYRFFFGP